MSYARRKRDLRCSVDRVAFPAAVPDKKISMYPPAGAPALPAVLAQLRAATASRHAALEAQLQLTQPLSLARYTRVLQGFDAFLSAWEPLAESHLPVSLRPWFAAGRRGRHARADLQALGAEPRVATELRLALPDASAALGSVYVIEGSALGAQVIAPMLLDRLGLDAHNGAAYFALPAASAARRWREFRELLAQHATHAAHATRAATDTFDALGAAFRESALDRADA